MGFQRGHGHAAVGTGVDAVARVVAAHVAIGRGQAPVAWLGQPGGGIGQGDFDAHAAAGVGAFQQGLQHGLAGHQGATHVGVQGGGHLGAGDQARIGQVGEVVARLLGPLGGRAHDAHQRQARVFRLQGLPTQAELGQGRWAERGDQHIGARQLLVQRGLALGRLEMGVQHPHALVQRGIGGRAVDAHGVGAGVAGHRRWFELGAFGAHARAAHQGGGAGQVQGEAQDAGVAQGLGQGGGHVSL